MTTRREARAARIAAEAVELDDLDNTLVSHGRLTDAERLIARLKELGWTLGVAESLTGGLVAAALVAVPGASAVLRGAVVAYATDIKQNLLGVDATLLAAHGPVHPRVARQMAEGVRRALGPGSEPADVGIATTGIAGPVSPDGQPVGTVHLAVSTPLGSRVESLVLTGSREEIRAEAAARAVRLAFDAL
jgi:nicotinamide-nucleotide amidase